MQTTQLPDTDQNYETGRRSMTTNALHILFVTPRYFPYMGGVENHVHQVAQRLVRMGSDVTVLTTDPSGKLATHELIEGVKIQRVRAWPPHRDYYFAPGIYHTIMQGKWDVMHLQSYHTLVAPLAMMAALRVGIPYIVTFHGGGHSSRLRNQLRGVQVGLLRPLLARAARLVATAQFEIPFFGTQLRVSSDRFVFIPNGADMTSEEDIALTPPEDSFIASVGRLERYKGHHRAIAALPKVLEQRPNARLWIAGDGPYEPELLRLAQKLGVADRVEIRAIPAHDRQGMAQALARTALVVLLSEYETHPMAVIEALALGRPALVADTSGLRELAQRGLARAVSLDASDDQIAMAMLAQLADPIRPTSLNLPTWNNCAETLLQVYQTILETT